MYLKWSRKIENIENFNITYTGIEYVIPVHVIRSYNIQFPFSIDWQVLILLCQQSMIIFF